MDLVDVLLLQHPPNIYGGVHDAPENDSNGGGSEGAEQVFFHTAIHSEFSKGCKDKKMFVERYQVV